MRSPGQTAPPAPVADRIEGRMSTPHPGSRYEDPPTVPIRVARAGGRPWVRMVVAASAFVLLVAAAAVGTLLVVGPGTSATASGRVDAPAPTPGPAGPVTPAAPACPAAPALVRAFVERSGFTGVRAAGPVACADGFAAVTVAADQAPDNVRTIYAVGPPVRLLRMGTGPICSDDPADGTTLVPRSAAGPLGCMTSAADRTSAAPVPAAGPDPTLGVVWAPNQEGFGDGRPRRVYAGGDPSSILENLRWSGWGDPEATATGTGYWTPPGGYVSDSVQRPAVVTASNLGVCHGAPAYRTITWYFPTEGETPGDAGGFDDICDGP